MKKFIEQVGDIDIYFEAITEHESLSSLLPEESKESLEKISLENVVFIAKVHAELNNTDICGIEVYLGGCIYGNESDFYEKYKNENFSDMKAEAIENLENEILRLNKIFLNRRKKIN
tara:strand:+ start:199 stop:549 length:351 start_codon:yes stop_codon:yes gene_type:complete